MRHSVKSLLLAGLLILLCVFGVTVVMSLSALYESKESLDTINRQIRVILNIIDPINHSRTARVWAAQADALQEAGRPQAATDALRTARAKLDLSAKSAKEYAAKVADEEERKVLASYMGAFDTYLQQGVMPLLDALETGDRKRYVDVLLNKTMVMDRQFEIALDAALAHRENAAKALNDSIQARFRRDLWTMFVLGVSMVAVAGAIFVLAQRHVLRPLAAASTVLKEVASGNISFKLERGSIEPIEIHSMLDNLSLMQQRLTHTILAIRSASDSVNLASIEIAQGSLYLSQRTESQASALQQTAASVSQLDENIRGIGANAGRAKQLTDDVSAEMGRSNMVVGQVVSTMRSISTSSKKIGEIIALIDSIAFQTNILALNAAVEAARAGEHGRGFSVVAGEVRMLAHRCADAAKDIAGLITNSMEQVAVGAGLADQAGSLMSQMESAIKKVQLVVADISASTAEQGKDMSSVGIAIGQIDEGTQQNAALVEESAASSEGLKQQAQQLSELVKQFELAERA